jgi:hypothetical protein
MALADNEASIAPAPLQPLVRPRNGCRPNRCIDAKLPSRLADVTTWLDSLRCAISGAHAEPEAFLELGDGVASEIPGRRMRLLNRLKHQLHFLHQPSVVHELA